MAASRASPRARAAELASVLRVFSRLPVLRAGRSWSFLWVVRAHHLLLVQAEKRQDGQHDDHEADQINHAVHFAFLRSRVETACVLEWFRLGRRNPRFAADEGCRSTFGPAGNIFERRGLAV